MGKVSFRRFGMEKSANSQRLHNFKYISLHRKPINYFKTWKHYERKYLFFVSTSKAMDFTQMIGITIGNPVCSVIAYHYIEALSKSKLDDTSRPHGDDSLAAI